MLSARRYAFDNPDAISMEGNRLFVANASAESVTELTTK